jgi:predicted Kef-type K+ transport protein
LWYRGSWVRAPSVSLLFNISRFLFIQGNLRFKLSWIEDRFEALPHVQHYGFPACSANMQTGSPISLPSFQYSPFLFIQSDLRFKLSWIEDRFEALPHVQHYGFPACSANMQTGSPISLPSFQYFPFLFIQSDLRFRLSWIEDRFEALPHMRYGFPACSANMQTGSPISLPSFQYFPLFIYSR